MTILRDVKEFQKRERAKRQAGHPRNDPGVRVAKTKRQKRGEAAIKARCEAAGEVSSFENCD